MCSSFVSLNYKAVKSRFLSLLKGELLKFLVVTIRLDHTFLFCCSPSSPCSHFLLLAATSVFPAFLHQFHAPCAGSSAAGFALLAGGENMSAFSWPVLLISFPARKLLAG